ncbi:MAG: UDP-N-acetylmuramoyl-L-alanine--D-glutamate ligase [bacterium]|nr:UDP-N-acetylmuramoyl-L-alanine--D-glutamate ligase [bacterium]
MENWKSKKVLVMGLGVLGGGLATAKWLVNQGAKVTVTDLRSRAELTNSIKKLGPAGKKISFVLGRHRLVDFQNNEVIVVNPAVRRESEFLKASRKAGRILTNDARIFFDSVTNPIIAVTGTRGKTTTTNWIAHLLKGKYPKVVAAGNSSDIALLDLAARLSDKKMPLVIELSSWQLEFLNDSQKGPDIAVITNIYPDHLNRYKNVRDYALAKANIFKSQRADQFLILNKDNNWTKFFLTKKIKAGICFSSSRNRKIIFDKKNILPAGFLNKSILEKGEHNVANLLAAVAAVRLFGLNWLEIKNRIKNLPAISYRQEIVLKKNNLAIINDSAGTSPDAVMAAIDRFRKQGRVFLITGGTDKNLIFNDLAKKIKENINPTDLFLLNGSATKKLLKELEKMHYFKNQPIRLFEDLGNLLKTANLYFGKKVSAKERKFLVFSPGAASFEKFKNEFDRGDKFNLLMKRIFKS